MMTRMLCLLVGYLCGSILTAEVVARRLAGRSIFELGDGNPGMANVGHELGLPAALACLAGDILKTLLPVLAMHRLLPALHLFPLLSWQSSTAWTGLGATLGHDFPFWHRFRGGKGVTTIASTIILIHPLWGILAGVVAVVTIVLSGYLSVGALAGIGFYTIAMYLTGPFECAFVSWLLLMLSLYGHWSKLVGIGRGTTHRASLSTKFWARMRRRS